MSAFDNIIGAIHGFHQRAEDARVKGALANYLTDPDASIAAVNAINPNLAIPLAQQRAKALQDQELQRQEKLKFGQEQSALTDKTAQEHQVRVLGAVNNMAQMLGRARDSGQDVGAVFDQISPVLSGGLGMTPEEVTDWKGRITANPKLIDTLIDTTKDKLTVLTPGSEALDAHGNVVRHNAAGIHPVTLKDALGNEHLYAMDAAGNLVQGGLVPPGTGMGGSGVPPLTQYTGPKTIDPTARGVRNGNPTNIKAGPWAKKQPGYLGADAEGFARFAPGAGDTAAEANLTRYFQSGKNTVNRIIDGTGPTNPGWLGWPGAGNENSDASRANYKTYLAGRLGIDPNAPIPPSRLSDVRHAISEFENGAGGGSGGAPAAASPGELAGTTAVKPTKPDYRIATVAEKTAAGVQPNVPYQISPDGKMEPIGPTATSNAKLKVTPEQLAAQKASTIDGLRSMVREARGILAHPSFNQATGSIQGRLPSLFQGSADFDSKLQSYRDKTVINTIGELKRLSATGATGFGQLSEKEGSRLENSKGSLDQKSPTNLRTTLSENMNDALVGIGVIKLNGDVPSDAVRLLIKQPGLAKQFDQKYGAGKARMVLEETR